VLVTLSHIAGTGWILARIVWELPCNALNKTV